MTIALGYYSTIAVAGWLTISALHGRDAGPGTRPFAFFGILIGLWSVGELMLLTAETQAEIATARRTFMLAAAGVPPTWFWLAARSANPTWYARHPERLGLALIVPVYYYVSQSWQGGVPFLPTTPMAAEAIDGTGFDLFATHQYVLCVLGTGYFARTAMRLGRSSRSMMTALIAGVALPLAVNLPYALGLDFSQHDYTAIALGPASILMWISVIESGLTTGLPIDHNEVIERLDVGVIVADPEGRITSANAAAERLTDTDDLRGRLLPEAVASAEQRQDAVIECRGIPLQGRFGIIGHALIMNDRSDAEATRRRLELGGRLEALGSLTAGIAHEVNNPLAFIQSNLSALEHTAKQLAVDPSAAGLSPALRDEVGDMAAIVEETQEGVERIRLLVQRLKNFSRTPDLDATAVEVDLIRSLRQAAAVASIGQTGEPIEITGDPNLRVLTIETALFQILVNLLLNAVQAAPEAPRVEVAVSEKQAGLSIVVRDRGPGLPESLLPRIFDPFFTTKPTGTGLGLSLSYDLATQLGGHLEASNREGGGAAFELWLPRVPPQSSPAFSGAHDAAIEEPVAVA